tara:strand:+ start:45 stop:329 length:285 start_codon:yes stop_codon:yes gene_type:complete
MCSTPKGKSGPVKPQHSISGISASLSSEQYRTMVERSNAAYERRSQRRAMEAALSAKTSPTTALADKKQHSELASLMRYLLSLLHISIAPRQKA